MKNRSVSPKDLKKLSAYLDGQLSHSEVQHLEARFQKDALLKKTYLELKQTRTLLKHAKTYQVPRNFTLTPEMAAQIKPAKRPFAIPALSVSSALAALVMIFALLFELIPTTNLASFVRDQKTSEVFMESAPALAPMAADTIEENALSEEAGTKGLEDLHGNPPIINWGGQAYQGGGNGVGGMGGGNGGLPIGGGVEEEPAITAMEMPQEMLPETQPDEQPVEEQPQLDVPPADAPIEPSPEPQTTTGGEEQESPPTRQAEAAEKSASEPLTGAGPILGVRSAEEAQAYNDTVLEILENEESAYQRMQNQVPLIRIIQILSGIIAILTGLAAVWFYRKPRL